MSAEAFEVGNDRKLTVAELQQMLSDAFTAGCELGFKEGLEGAKQEVKSQHADLHIVVAIDDICGPNIFAVMVGFEKWLKEKGGKA